MTEEFLREVEEDLKSERYAKLWKRYGSYLIAAAFLIVLATVAWELWQQYDLRQRQALSDRYAAALDTALSNDRDAAVAALAAVAAETRSGYAALARLQAAALLADKGDTAGALAVYDAVAADRSTTPAALRDLAIVLGAVHAAASEPPASIERRVAPLNNDQSPWRFTAREALASALLKAGEMERARGVLRKVADDVGAPSGARARAAELLAALDA